MKKISYMIVSGTLGAVALFSTSLLNAQTSLKGDFSMEHQGIDHFGASGAWSVGPTISSWMAQGNDSDIERMADLLFSTTEGIGLSAWRFNIGAGSAEQGGDSGIPDPFRRAELFIAEPAGEVDSSKQIGQVRFMQEAQERGVTNFIAFANSPPVWATKNGLAHPGSSSSRSLVGTTNLKRDSIDDFSNFLVDVLEYFWSDDVGVPVNYISPINEPTWSWENQTQEANRYNIEDLKSVYRSLHSALDRSSLNGSVQIDGAEVVEYAAALSDSYKVKFDGSVYSGGMNGEGLGSYKNYIPELLGDAEMKGILGNHLSMHGYFSDAWANRMGLLRDLTWQNIQEVSPGARIWMSEMTILGGTGNVRDFRGPGYDVEDMDFALHVGKMVHRDLTRLNASAWHWWLALTPYDYKDGLLKVNSSLESSSLQDSKAMWALGNFSRFIRPGFTRIDMQTPDDLDGLMASAYKSGNEDKIVIVAVNTSNSTESVNLNISNLPSGKMLGSFDVTITNSDLNLSFVGSVTSSFNIPARSIVSFVADITDISMPESTLTPKPTTTENTSFPGGEG